MGKDQRHTSSALHSANPAAGDAPLFEDFTDLLLKIGRELSLRDAESALYESDFEYELGRQRDPGTACNDCDHQELSDPTHEASVL
jgi:hypothetical protein